MARIYSVRLITTMAIFMLFPAAAFADASWHPIVSIGTGIAMMSNEGQSTSFPIQFTSQRVMAAVYDAMPPNVRKHVLLQGDLPKSTLLQQHKRAVNLNSLSIIFGLQSFAEGVDLPGNYCRHVVITKLPFSVPSTPIEQTWVKWLESQGKNGFQHHTLPEASLRLVQYAGRLIRTQEDVGTLTIMDRRMITKFYGKQLLASLPPFRVQK